MSLYVHLVTFLLAQIWILRFQSGHTFEHVATAQLSRHVQICDMIDSLFIMQGLHVLRDLDYWLKNPLRNGPILWSYPMLWWGHTRNVNSSNTTRFHEILWAILNNGIWSAKTLFKTLTSKINLIKHVWFCSQHCACRWHDTFVMTIAGTEMINFRSSIFTVTALVELTNMEGMCHHQDKSSMDVAMLW